MIMLGLIEDDPMLRKNYEDFFKRDPNFCIVFSLKDRNMLASNNLKMPPNVVLLDLLLPNGNGLNYIKEIKYMFPSVKVIVLSGLIDPYVTQAAMDKGANGFLLKSHSLNYIKETLLSLGEEGIPLSPVAVNHLFQKKDPNKSLPVHNLTKRELELVKVLQAGVSNKVAAARLNVTFFTVNQHLKSIYKKLNINSKSELLALSIK